MYKKFNKAFVLSPHTDDGELGAGGLISRLIDEGTEVYYIAFSTAEASVPDHLPKHILKTEVVAACLELGIIKDNIILHDYEVRKLNYSRQEILENLIELRNFHKPDLVIMPSAQDIHQDHSTISSEGLRAFKNTTLLGYELIWNNLKFDSSLFVKLTEDNLRRKIKALQQYNSQSGKDYMSKDFITSLAKIRGVQIGFEYAESFEVIRWVID